MSHITRPEEKADSFVSDGGTKTISSVDAALRSWVLAAVPEVQVTFSPPSSKEAPVSPEVSAWLHQVQPLPVMHAAHGPSELRVTLRYLLTVAGADESRTHDILHALLVAAVNAPLVVGGPPWMLAQDMPGDSFWQAMGVPPQPCLILTTQLKLPKKSVPEAPPVREIVTRWETAPPSKKD